MFHSEFFPLLYVYHSDNYLFLLSTNMFVAFHLDRLSRKVNIAKFVAYQAIVPVQDQADLQNWLFSLGDLIGVNGESMFFAISISKFSLIWRISCFLELRIMIRDRNGVFYILGIIVYYSFMVLHVQLFDEGACSIRCFAISARHFMVNIKVFVLDIVVSGSVIWVRWMRETTVGVCEYFCLNFLFGVPQGSHWRKNERSKIN